MATSSASGNSIGELHSAYPVLVWFEEERIRANAVSALRRAGYSVAIPADAREAARAIDRHGACILVTDRRLPVAGADPMKHEPAGATRLPRVYALRHATRIGGHDLVIGIPPNAHSDTNLDRANRELLGQVGSGMAWLTGDAPVPSAAGVPGYAMRNEGGAPAIPRVLNQLSFELAAQFEACRRRGTPVSALLCAVDEPADFQRVLGRDLASQVLSGLQLEAAKTLLASEWVAPCGRQGLAIVLPDAGLDQAAHVARKLHAALTRFLGELPSAALPERTTLSVGASTLETLDRSRNLLPIHLLRATERCLAESVGRGGGTVTARPAAFYF